MTPRMLAAAPAASLTPVKGLIVRSIGDKLDGGDHAALPHIADVRKTGETGQILAQSSDLAAQLLEHTLAFKNVERSQGGSRGEWIAAVGLN